MLDICRRTLALCLFIVVCARACAAAQAFPKRADAYLENQARSERFRGAVLVRSKGKILFERGYGFADEEWKILNSPETRFRIFSITKHFTATSILILQDQGKLDVRDALSRYWPDAPATWQNITIHQLLTHTSG
jgi:D-alanyl-D-alanine carboxypeptidase